MPPPPPFEVYVTLADIGYPVSALWVCCSKIFFNIFCGCENTLGIFLFIKGEMGSPIFTHGTRMFTNCNETKGMVGLFDCV